MRATELMYLGFEEYERQKAQARLGLKPWLKWPSVIEEQEKMNYEEMVAIGSNLNAAIQQTLREYEIDTSDGQLVGALAQAILVQLDRAGYKIVHK